MQIKSLEDLKALNGTGDEATDSAITQIVKNMDCLQHEFGFRRWQRCGRQLEWH